MLCYVVHFNKLMDSWDLPLALQKKYDGWLSREIIQDYLRYAKLCFDRYGDRVKHWLTFNEPWCVAVLGNGIAQFAPYVSCL
jgi:beta-glucosidase